MELLIGCERLGKVTERLKRVQESRSEMAKVEVLTAVDKTFNTSDLQIGDIGVAAETEGAISGHFLLKMYDGLVSLDQPNSTWTWPRGCPVNIKFSRVYRKGSGTRIGITL